MSRADRKNAASKWEGLIAKLSNERFRHAYFEKQLKAFLANQIRAIRGNATQKEFAKTLGTTQSVVSRLEDENYGKVNAQTLIDIAKKLKLGLVIKFVDFPTFLMATDDMSEQALRPHPFDERSLSELTRPNFGRAPKATTSTISVERAKAIAPAPQAVASLSKGAPKRPGSITTVVQ